MRKILIYLMAVLVLFSVSKKKAYAAEVTAEQTMKAANGLLENQCYTEAIKEFLRVVYIFKDERNSAEAEYKTGQCLMQNKKYWRAIAQWESVEKKYPATEWATKSKESIKLTTIVIEDVSRKVQYPLSLKEKIAYTYIRFGDDFASRGWVTLGSGVKDMEKNEFETAQFWYEKVVMDYPDTFIAPYALEKLGTAYYNGDQKQYFVKAVECYQKISKLFSDRTLWVLRGLRLAADTNRDKLKKSSSKPLYQKFYDISSEKIGSDSFYKNYAETQLKVVQ
jgi:tetratricopeptide (TPR) repeat protein